MHRRRYTVEENELEKKFSLAERERDEYRRLYLEMMERYRKLERGILGSKSEHLPPNESQLTLDVLRTSIRPPEGTLTPPCVTLSFAAAETARSGSAEEHLNGKAGQG